ncbi:MAG TPA: DNA polymerase/3'-5' exonuclease PolX, partial [Clostridiales bacterium]|nr:DNA polymerase/3'-5' exonuclease PolX [Clostridiales bacterium]
MDEDVADLHEAGRLTEIPGVGGALARKIGELIESGRLAYHERLAAEVPPGVLDLLRLPGVGPRTAGLLWRRLGVEDLETLEEAARSGSLRKLPGFGPKKEAAVLEGLAALRRRSGRIPLGEARPAALALVDLLSAVPGVTAVSPAGGVRRWCETVESI